jgi:uncharacterized protein (DUF2336 family)
MAAASLIPELEEVVRHGSAKRRAEMLGRITALFVDGASRFNSDHIQLFGDVLTQLSGDVDADARVELAHLLAPVPNAPPALLRRLAEDENIAVARPILKQSPQLGEPDLIDIAQSKGQAHLLALSKRKAIGAPLTDILIGRGERDVLCSLAENLDAQFSQEAYAALIERAVQDDALAEKIGLRRDIPPGLFCNLLLKSTQTVRDRLTASARPEVQSEIRRVLGEAAHSAAEPRDYSVAERAIRDLHQHGRLDEGRIVEFANQRQYEELVVGLAALCEVPLTVVDRLMASDRSDPILILCKGAGWSWPTVRAIMAAIPERNAKSSAELDAAFANFERLSPTTAQRVMRFWQVQHWQHAPAADANP